jgi:hypothetical protein
MRLTFVLFSSMIFAALTTGPAFAGAPCAPAPDYLCQTDSCSDDTIGEWGNEWLCADAAGLDHVEWRDADTLVVCGAFSVDGGLTEAFNPYGTECFPRESQTHRFEARACDSAGLCSAWSASEVQLIGGQYACLEQDPGVGRCERPCYEGAPLRFFGDIPACP